MCSYAFLERQPSSQRSAAGGGPGSAGAFPRPSRGGFSGRRGGARQGHVRNRVEAARIGPPQRPGANLGLRPAPSHLYPPERSPRAALTRAAPRFPGDAKKPHRATSTSQSFASARPTSSLSSTTHSAWCVQSFRRAFHCGAEASAGMDVPWRWRIPKRGRALKQQSGRPALCPRRACTRSGCSSRTKFKGSRSIGRSGLSSLGTGEITPPYSAENHQWINAPEQPGPRRRCVRAQASGSRQRLVGPRVTMGWGI